MGSYSDRAYILHQRPYRESSVIVDLLTEKNGRVSAICKGVRASSKKASLNRALLQLFSELTITLSGRSELKTIAQLDLASKAFHYEKHSLYAALYTNELLVRLLYKDEQLPNIYSDYKEALFLITQAVSDPKNLERALRLFELKLLKQLGFEIDFYYDDNNVSVNIESVYSFHPERGFRQLTHESEQNASEEVAVLVSGDELVKCQSMTFEQQSTLNIIKKITRYALKLRLGDKPLQSRLFYQKL